MFATPKCRIHPPRSLHEELKLCGKEQYYKNSELARIQKNTLSEGRRRQHLTNECQREQSATRDSRKTNSVWKTEPPIDLKTDSLNGKYHRKPLQKDIGSHFPCLNVKTSRCPSDSYSSDSLNLVNLRSHVQFKTTQLF